MSNDVIIAEIQKALRAHGLWKMRLITCIKTGKNTHNVADVRSDHKCEFGHWLHGSGIDSATKNGKPYQVIRRLHAEFHECAANALQLVQVGRTEEAQIILDGEFTQKSEILILALNKWKHELAVAEAA